jgi:hypothetical protein
MFVKSAVIPVVAKVASLMCIEREIEIEREDGI